MTLIGYWPLNEQTGTKAYDYSGNENHGNLYGGISQGVEGLLGNSALGFDGGDDYVSFNSKLIPDNGGITICAWIKPLGAHGTRDNGMIVSEGDNATGDDGLDFQHRSDSDNIWVRYDRGGSTILSVESQNGSVPKDEWTHVAFSWDGTTDAGAAKIYVDGVLVKETTSSSTPTEGAHNTIIGFRDSLTKDAFNGRISEVRIYNRALTSAEIQYLYNVAKRGSMVSSTKQV